jgi:methylthioribose-1-phosphate isomerase
MQVGDKYYEAIWIDEYDPSVIKVIDQRGLPFSLEVRDLRSVDDIYNAIRDMTIRGAPLTGAAGAFGIYLATLGISSTTGSLSHLENIAGYLASSRPTAVNLAWAIDMVMNKLRDKTGNEVLSRVALEAALEVCDIEKNNCLGIGNHGLTLLRDIAGKKKGKRVNILTHCNAGWLACIDHGTVMRPIYLAHGESIPVHVWVDETRPRNQGSRLTAWEMEQAGIPSTLIVDNAGGHLMQHGMVDIVIVGCDRVTRKGDVANKIGTYLKALAARDNDIPFYAAVPSTSIDFRMTDGIAEIPVEQRDAEEITLVPGLSSDGHAAEVRICASGTPVANFGFDVTPARFITGLITERGTCKADEKEIMKLFPDKLF